MLRWMAFCLYLASLLGELKQKQTDLCSKSLEFWQAGYKSWLGTQTPTNPNIVQQRVIHTLISLHEYSEHGIPTLLLLYKDNIEVIKLVMTWYLNSFFVLFVCQWLSSVCNTEWHSYIDFTTCSWSTWGTRTDAGSLTWEHYFLSGFY